MSSALNSVVISINIDQTCPV